MLTKIKRKECLDRYPKFPLRWYDDLKDEVEHFYPQTYSGYVLTLSSKSVRGHIKLLVSELIKIVSDLGYEQLIFLGDSDIPWLRQSNAYKPAKEALQFLVENKIGKRFNGALEVDKTYLAIFLKHLYWLSRCNAVLPYIYFVDPGQNILGTICQYGNLHITIDNKKTDMFFKNIVGKSRFEFLTDRVCYERFSKGGVIKGRQITY
jgi:hypothetical protein